jgi:hypothetical protein
VDARNVVVGVEDLRVHGDVRVRPEDIIRERSPKPCKGSVDGADGCANRDHDDRIGVLHKCRIFFVGTDECRFFLW